MSTPTESKTSNSIHSTTDPGITDKKMTTACHWTTSEEILLYNGAKSNGSAFYALKRDDNSSTALGLFISNAGQIRLEQAPFIRPSVISTLSASDLHRLLGDGETNGNIQSFSVIAENRKERRRLKLEFQIEQNMVSAYRIQGLGKEERTWNSLKK